MKIRAPQLIWIGIIALGAWMLWSALAPNETRKIRGRLDSLASAISVTSGQSNLMRIAQASDLSPFFTEDFTVRIDYPGGAFSSRTRAESVQMIKRLKISTEVESLEVIFEEIEIDLAPDKTTATARLTGVVHLNEQRHWLTDRFEFQLQKIDGAWRIANARQIQPGSL